MTGINYESGYPLCVSKGATSEEKVLWGDTNLLFDIE
jgi:hypothetical protein